MRQFQFCMAYGRHSQMTYDFLGGISATFRNSKFTGYRCDLNFGVLGCILALGRLIE